MPHSSHRTRSVGHSASLQQLPATRACGLKVVSHPTVHRRIGDLGGCNVFPITLPPLRHRKQDLPLLVRHFVRRYAEKYGKSIAAIPAHAMNAMEAHDWPGNVRELQHVIERAVILTRGAELAFDAGILDPAPGGPSGPPPIGTLEAAERSHILKALEACGWQVSGKAGAADLLGLRPSTLDFRIKKLGIKRPA